MARISDLVEELIKKMIRENNGSVEISRSELADQANCVPSQITYVLSTRFTNNHGYLVESRRGGGGWIRIQQVQVSSPSHYLMHAVNGIGRQLTQHQADVLIQNFIDYDVVLEREARLIRSALSDQVLNRVSIEKRDRIRSMLLKNMLTSLLVE